MKLIFITTITFFIFLSQAIAGEDLSAVYKQKAIIDAQKADPSVHQAYLKCYALKPESKVKCSKHIIKEAKIKLDKELQTNPYYLTTFSHEAERLGFASYLKTNNLPCEKINDGPIFDKQAKTYTVLCTNGSKYYMHFNYKTNHWQLKAS